MMEENMPTPALSPRVSGRSRIITRGFHVAILTLDIAAIITLAVSLGLFHKWIPSTSYPTTALQPARRTDWTDLIVLIATLVSFEWTIFILIRPAWTDKKIHAGYAVAFEFISLVWLLACTITAFMRRDSLFKNLDAISHTCDVDSLVVLTLTNGAKLRWVCMPHLDTLKKLQLAAYSVACAIAFLHFILFSLACRSILQRPRDSAAETATSQQTENGSTEKIIHVTQEPITRRSESIVAPQPRIEVAEF